MGICVLFLECFFFVVVAVVVVVCLFSVCAETILVLVIVG